LRFAETVLEEGPDRCNHAPMPRKPKPPSCEDCYFRRNLLCALELNEPCTTFRADQPAGLVPPRQPVLLMRPPRWATHSSPA
jgi:hypothetical protein